MVTHGLGSRALRGLVGLTRELPSNVCQFNAGAQTRRQSAVRNPDTDAVAIWPQPQHGNPCATRLCQHGELYALQLSRDNYIVSPNIGLAAGCASGSSRPQDAVISSLALLWNGCSNNKSTSLNKSPVSLYTSTATRLFLQQSTAEQKLMSFSVATALLGNVWRAGHISSPTSASS